MNRFFKSICVIAATATATVAFAGCDIKPERVFFKNSGVQLPSYNEISVKGTTGWFGDGAIVYEFGFDVENGRILEEKVSDAEGWLNLPMTETLDYLVYEFFGSPVPRVDSGYYYFYDEQNKRFYAPEDFIEQSYSFDFVLCMYDNRNNRAYFYEQHT